VSSFITLRRSNAFEAREKLRKRERLGQIIIAAAAEAADPLVQACHRAEDQHRRRLAEVAHFGDDRQPIHAARQHAVEDDDVPVLVRCEVEAIDAVANQSDGIAGLSEAVADVAGPVSSSSSITRQRIPLSL
jgi:hypothetical protein